MSDIRKVVIIGASAAGLKCASRLARRRPEWDVTVLEARDVFSYGACGLPYVLSGDIDTLAELRTTSYGTTRDEAFFSCVKGVEVRSGCRVTSIDLEARTVAFDGADGAGLIDWDEFVLATGAHARRLPNQPEHASVHTFHTWDDVAPLKQGLARGELEHVAIVGAGLVGCELAEAFVSLWGAEVTLIEAGPSVLPQVLDPEVAALVEHELRKQEVTVLTGKPVEAIEADDDGVRVTTNGAVVEADAVVVAIGVDPAVELAVEAGLATGSLGGIMVDDRLATSAANVWAAGDCIEVDHVVSGSNAYLPLGSLANRQGRAVADAIVDGSGRFGPVAGAVAVKVFDSNVAAVGLTSEAATRSGRQVRTIWTTGEGEAHYWPDANRIHLQVVYELESSVVLGVQVVGTGEVAKRVDVAAQVMLRGGTLADLAEVEHAYAPPYAPAMEPLAVAAHAALNNEAENLQVLPPDTDLSGAVVLDVRTPEERESRPVEAGRVMEINLEDVGSRIDELPKTGLVVVCAHGARSAEVVRRLAHHGVEAAYVAGGMTWRAYGGLVKS